MTKETETTRKSAKTVRKSVEEPVAVAQKAVAKPADVKQPENDKVGAILYHERLKKDLNLAEIAQMLCIRRAYLEAIEKGNYAELPSMPYSAGFVNAYAKYLGLNHTRITQLFREEINVDTKSVNSFVNEDITSEASVPNKVYVLAGIAAAVLVGFAWSFFSPSSDAVDNGNTIAVETVVERQDSQAGEVEYFDASKAVADVVETVNENVKNEETASQVVISEESYVEKEVEAQPVLPQIEVKIVREDTWIEVRDADKVYISKVLHVGESYRFPDVKGLIFSSGKVKGVDVYVNGKITPVIQPNKKMNIKIDDVLNANH
uniref:Cytoskeleton protein RodZ-like C-terminal domain-containing protein n=1 Tax=uncultured Alphaproteobacteria bacterium TaxID=91750 RepID=A0A6G8F289_9PROT|nr:hypothetical protein PlAlph_1270 [uncultured Alphaproteobacteria bacterium]